MAWAREPVVHEGRNFQIPTSEGMGLGKPLKLMAKPPQERLPIYIGAIGPKSVELTGEIADGWIPAFFDPEDGAGLFDSLEAGLAKAGRDRSEIDIAPTVPVAVDDDLDEARNALRPLIAFYLGGMGAKDKNFYVDLLAANGLADEAHEVQDKFLGGRSDRRRDGALVRGDRHVRGRLHARGPREAGRPLRRLRRRLDDRDRLRLRPRGDDQAPRGARLKDSTPLTRSGGC